MKETTKNQITAFINKFWPQCQFSKPFLVIISILLGVLLTVLTQDIMKNRSEALAEGRFGDPWIHHQMLALNNDPFIASDSIFTEIENMEKSMDEMFENQRKYMKSVMSQAQSQHNKTAVSTRQDDKNYYYQLDFRGFKKEDVVVGVKDNVLTFSVDNKISNKDNNKDNEEHHSFEYSFSIPEYDHKKSPEISREDNKIVVTLTKKIAEKSKQ